MKRRFAANVNDAGELRIADPVAWRAHLSRLRGQRVRIVVDRERETRSLKANAYLWGVVYAVLAEWSGHEPAEIHEAMKARFLPAREVTLPTGELLGMSGTTANLDSAAFHAYVERVRRFAAESGCYVPDSNEVEVTL